MPAKKVAALSCQLRAALWITIRYETETKTVTSYTPIVNDGMYPSLLSLSTIHRPFSVSIDNVNENGITRRLKEVTIHNAVKKILAGLYSKNTQLTRIRKSSMLRQHAPIPKEQIM